MSQPELHLIRHYRSGASEDSSREARQSGLPKVERPTQSTLIVELAQAAHLQLFHTPERVAYADIRIDNHQETLCVQSKAFRGWLARRYYREYRKAPRAQALQDAIGVIEGTALYEGSQLSVHVRLAEYDGRVYLDLGHRDGSVVEVSSAGWQVIKESPVRFRRPSNLLPLPFPERGGQVEELLSLLNLVPDDWPLVTAWLIAALNPNGPYPVLFLQGEQGTGKSTLARMLKELIDPSAACLRAHPRELRDLMLAATNSWVLPFDNLSTLPVWLSDGLCRLSTGGSFATRALYHDDEEIVLNASRPTVLTGIEELPTRGDLLDRSILLYLPTMSSAKQRSNRQIWAEYEDLRPRVLGALLDAVSTALQCLPYTRLEQLPRMADFTMWAVAASPGLGLDTETFLSAYRSNREASHELALEDLPVAVAVRMLLENQSVWEGTATELHKVLAAYLPHKSRQERYWPMSSRGLSNTLRRLAPNLRNVGIDVSFHRTSQARTICLETMSSN